jgi:hypothetical protein
MADLGIAFLSAVRSVIFPVTPLLLGCRRTSPKRESRLRRVELHLAWRIRAYPNWLKTRCKGSVVRSDVGNHQAEHRTQGRWTTEEGMKSFFAAESKIELTPGGSYELYLGPAMCEALANRMTQSYSLCLKERIDERPKGSERRPRGKK